jgi:hypothetical protein
LVAAEAFFPAYRELGIVNRVVRHREASGGWILPA